MTAVALAHVLLTPAQLSALADEEPDVRWPRAFRGLVSRRPDPPAAHGAAPSTAAHGAVPSTAAHGVAPSSDGHGVAPSSDGHGEDLRDLFGDADEASLLRGGLRAFRRPTLRLRAVLRQGRVLTLTEVAAGPDGLAGALSTLLLDGDVGRDPASRSWRGGVHRVRPVGRVELAGAPSSALPSLFLRHVPGCLSSAPVVVSAATAEGAGTHPARGLVLRGWGRALVRPVVDVWAQDEHGWVRPDVGRGADAPTWQPVDAERFAADLAACLKAPLRSERPTRTEGER